MSFLGVNVTTVDTPSGPNTPPTDGSSYFVVGRTERGLVGTAVPVTSMTDYQNKLGGRVAYGYLYDDLTQFFAEGGQQAYVARVVGSGATTATMSLLDQGTGGGQHPTVRLDTISPGEWSTQLTVEVIASQSSPAPGGLPNTFTVILRLNGQAVEQYTNVATPAALVAAMANSNYVVATNLGSVNTSPVNNPATLGPAGVGTAFSAGNSDSGSINAAAYLAAAETCFSPALGCGALAFPGQSAGSIAAGALPLAAAGNRILLTSVPQGSSKSAAEAVATGLLPLTDPEYCGMFWPWTKIPDGFGGTYTIPPEGFVAGTRARVIKEFGAWRADFGTISQAQFVVGTELNAVMSSVDAAEVYATGINPIRIIGTNVEVYGWESMSSDPNFHFLSGRDVLNYLAYNSDLLLEQYVGQPIDAAGKLFTDITATLVSLVDPLAQAGGLFPLTDAKGNQIDPGYAITTGFALNPVANLAEGVINVSLGVRVSPAAQMINLVIAKVGFTQAAGGGS